MSLGAEPLFGSWTLTALVVVTVAAALWRFQPRLASPSRQVWLTGCRVVAALTLLLILVRPGLTRSDNRPTTATLLVAIDTSASMVMEVSDPAGGAATTRYAVQNDLLERLLNRVRAADSAADLDVELVGYDERLRPLGASGEGSATGIGDVPEVPTGQLTNLTLPLARGGEASATGPVLGIVLLGDGRQTRRADEVDQISTANAAAESLLARGVPLWSVPIGAGGPRRRDVAVSGLPPSMRLYAGTDLEQTVELTAAGAAGRDVSLRWVWTDAAGQTRDAASRKLNASGNDWQTAVSVTLRAPPPGEYRLEVIAAPIDGEAVLSNNRVGSFVEVSEGGGRLLMLAGTVGLESAYLRRAIAGFADLQLSTRLIPPDTADRWPIELNELGGESLQDDRFDAVLVHGLPAAAIGDSQWEKVAEMVGDGGGLLMLGGVGSLGQDYRDSPIAATLPVTLQNDELESDDERFTLRPDRRHPITQLDGGGALDQLPAQIGLNRFAGVRISPGVQTILRAVPGGGDRGQEPLPAMVLGEYGRGRVATVAFDSTWRWVRDGHAETHRRFWRQTLLWLLARGDDDSPVRLELPVRRVGREQRTDFRAVFEPDATPGVAQASVRIVRSPGGETVAAEVQLSRGRESIDGVVGALPPGIYRIEVLGNGDQVLASRAFEVIDDSVESTQSEADPATLRRLATITEPVGGAWYDAGDIEPLVDEIIQRHRSAAQVVLQRDRLGDSPATAWPLLIVFAAALSAEWWLRRRWGIEI